MALFLGEPTSPVPEEPPVLHNFMLSLLAHVNLELFIS